MNFVESNKTRLLVRGSGLTEPDKETWAGVIVARPATAPVRSQSKSRPSFFTG
jgi:hypothetical protein